MYMFYCLTVQRYNIFLKLPNIFEEKFKLFLLKNVKVL